MVKVFFNNSCNICRAEINHYKKHSDNSVEWIDVTNNEAAQKITSKSYKELLEKNPERIIEEAVKGMLPKNKLGKSIIKKLKVFNGPEHSHESQQPIEWNPS